MSWSQLPHELKSAILRLVCELDYRKPTLYYKVRHDHHRKVKKRWKPIAPLLLVSREFYILTRDILLCTYRPDDLALWASESIAFCALKEMVERERAAGDDCWKAPLAEAESLIEFPPQATNRRDQALIIVTIRAFESCMRLLLANGANPQTLLYGSRCPLTTIAVENASPEAVKLLLEHGAPLEIATLSNREPSGYNTPLGWAIYFELCEVIPLLVEAGASRDIVVRLRDKEMDPMQYAAGTAASSTLLTVLLTNGFVLSNDKYEPGAHPLEMAVSAGHGDRAEILRQTGAIAPDVFCEASLSGCGLVWP
ncbi:hypothetical protein VTO42DRAFT_7978 [Malbranchea cinnamomea]